jgi:hypothetical protein
MCHLDLSNSCLGLIQLCKPLALYHHIQLLILFGTAAAV